jgi:ABC-type lipoprotein export system ATPase subunit
MALLSLEAVERTHVRGGRELRVLRGVSLELRAGEFVAVFGSRSAGKSTLLRIAAGLERPDAGVVRFDGADLARANAARLAAIHRSGIGWVDRGGPRGDELSVAEYVSLPLLGNRSHSEARREATTALERVGARDCAPARWSDLADAERMQVALAHGLVRSPRLLVCDDPTAGLDVIERERIVSLLRTLADDTRVGVLMAVPDMPAMLRAHEVLTLSGGRLLAPPERPRRGGTVIDFPGGERTA